MSSMPPSRYGFLIASERSVSADLSTLTGAKIAIVVEAESGKKSAFGTPSANALIDSFLSEHNPYIAEGEMAKITHLQDELFRLKKGQAMEDKRERESKTRLKVIQDTSRITKILSNDVDDLGAKEASELFLRLEQVQNDINNHANPRKQLEVIGQSGSLLPLYSSSWYSQIKMPPRRLPWVSLQASSQRPRSSWSQSYFLDPITLPSPQAPHSHVLHHQGNMIPPFPNDEAHQYIYYFPQPQPPTLPLQVEQSFNPMAPANPNCAHTNNITFNLMEPPYQNHAYTHNSNPVAPPKDHANSHNFDVVGQPPVTPLNDIDFFPSLDALTAFLGLADAYGDQTDGGQDDEPDPSSMNPQADDDGLTMNLWKQRWTKLAADTQQLKFTMAH
ncbi:hypothetical protein EJB05_14497, partial [Eragrostis curvula]